MSDKPLRAVHPTATPEELEYLKIHEARLQYLIHKIELLHLAPGAPILDVGCYPPFLFHYLESKGYAMSGVAAHHEQLQQDNIAICNIETEKLPWKTSVFSAVIFTEVIEHLPHSPLVPLQELYRVLQPGGSLLITTPNAIKLHHRLKLLAGKTVTFPLEQLLTVAPTDGSLYHLHNREYALSELTELVQRAGFTVAQASEVCLYPPFREKSQHESLPTRCTKWAGYIAQQLYPPFRDSLFVQAVKPV